SLLCAWRYSPSHYYSSPKAWRRDVSVQARNVVLTHHPSKKLVLGQLIGESHPLDRQGFFGSARSSDIVFECPCGDQRDWKSDDNGKHSRQNGPIRNIENTHSYMETWICNQPTTAYGTATL